MWSPRTESRSARVIAFMLGALSQRPEGSPTLFLHLGEDGAWEIGQSWAAVVGHQCGFRSPVSYCSRPSAALCTTSQQPRRVEGQISVSDEYATGESPACGAASVAESRCCLVPGEDDDGAYVDVIGAGGCSHVCPWLNKKPADRAWLTGWRKLVPPVGVEPTAIYQVLLREPSCGSWNTAQRIYQLPS